MLVVIKCLWILWPESQNDAIVAKKIQNRKKKKKKKGGQQLFFLEIAYVDTL